MIDDELKALCVVAVREELYRKMSQLMDRAKVAVGHDDYDSSKLYEVHSFGDGETMTEVWNIYFAWRNPEGPFGPDYMYSCGAESLVEALEDDRAIEVWMEGRKIFSKVGGEWRWNDESEIS